MLTKKVGIINYGAGNISSVFNAINFLEYEPKFISDPKEAKNFSHLILPGVGNFGKLAKNLKKKKWKLTLEQLTKNGHMLFGICIGMQLLFEKSEEAPDVEGLGFLSGCLSNFKSNDNNFKLPVPHIGFNLVSHKNTMIWKNIKNNSPFYFIHSYRIIDTDKNVVTCKTTYQDQFVSFIEKDNIYGAQFHPEKSHLTGLKLIKNFLELKN
jgi:imidazole glycerol phosphate synthase glutamine amidotransferase subunit